MANCLLRDLKSLEEALEHYSLSDSLEHQNPDMHCNWGLAWQLQERWDRAINQFEVAISQKSDHAPTSTSEAPLRLRSFEEACGALRQGVALDDSCNDAKFTRASLCSLSVNSKRVGTSMTPVSGCPTRSAHPGNTNVGRQA